MLKVKFKEGKSSPSVRRSVWLSGTVWVCHTTIQGSNPSKGKTFFWKKENGITAIAEG